MGTTRQKSSCRNRLQNGPHSLLRMKVGTHSPLPTGSHTAAHRAKRGAFRMGGGISTLGAFHTFRKPCVARYQNGKLCRFWGLVGCAPEERGEPAEQRCAHACRCSAGVAAPPGCAIFSVSVEIAACTHSALREKSHTRAYTAKHGAFWVGALSLPSEHSARFGNPAWPGLKTANFAAFGSWSGGALEERREPAEQRCAYARRCSKASRPRWAA